MRCPFHFFHLGCKTQGDSVLGRCQRINSVPYHRHFAVAFESLHFRRVRPLFHPVILMPSDLGTAIRGQLWRPLGANQVGN